MVAEHLSFMANKNIVVMPELQHLQSFYWLPKLHKQPYGARFIAASNKCTTKTLSKLLTSCLSTISCHFKQYCSGIYSRTGVNCYWIIHNSQQVLSALNTINYFSTARLLTVTISLRCTQVFHMYLSNMPWPFHQRSLQSER